MKNTEKAWKQNQIFKFLKRFWINDWLLYLFNTPDSDTFDLIFLLDVPIVIP